MKTATTPYWESSVFFVGVMAIIFFFVVPGGRRKPHARDFGNPRSIEDGGMSSEKKPRSLEPETEAARTATVSTGV